MADFADRFTLKLGDTVVKGTRLSIREIRENLEAVAAERFSTERALELIKSRVTLEDGRAFDPEDLTNDQVGRLIAEMTLPKEGRGISDFIGLLC